MTTAVTSADRLLNELEAAALLNLKPTTLRRWRWAGRGPRFIKMVHAYDPTLLRLAAHIARRRRVPFQKGVYAGVRGPAFETPAEVVMLRRMGAAAVGMSTVQEVTAARQMGARCLGLSLIANAAHGHHAGNVTHEEVLEAMDRYAGRLGRIILGVIRDLL